MLLPASVFASDPVITSDSRTFDPLSGEYTLTGHVYVRITPHDQEMIITGDYTKVKVYSMEVHGKGNINLTYGDLNFTCAKTDVYHSNRTAYVEGNITFKDGPTTITADKGSYCWKTKLAAFQGNVVVNGQAYDHDIQYDVTAKKVL